MISMESKREPGIIVALDGISEHYALHLAEQLQDVVWGFKVNDLLVSSGASVIFKLKKFGKVMADPKFFDIPNTVGNGVKRLADLGADLITCHVLGGTEMLSSAVKAAAQSNKDTRIVGITVLTSMSDIEHNNMYHEPRWTMVLRLMSIARQVGVDHIVCAGNEAREAKREGLTSIVPGIRFPGTEVKHDDQQQVTRQLTKDIDYVVIGRPIVADANPIDAAYRIKDHIHAAYRETPVSV
jgi:orotidine-5'-phosphate decarboxylase